MVFAITPISRANFAIGSGTRQAVAARDMLVLAMQLCAPVPVRVRRGLTTNNLVTPNFASNINPGAFADEAGPPIG